MTIVLTVAQLGNEILRRQAESVSDVRHPAIQQLIDSLIATVKAENGVGIAAPQVGESLRVIVVASRPNERYPHAPKMEPTALINPRIVGNSGVVLKDWEGCLCVPGIRGLVPRYEGVAVEYGDREGRVHQREFTGFVARILQHEVDHLEGIIFLDRMESTQDLVTEQEYLKRIAVNSSWGDGVGSVS